MLCFLNSLSLECNNAKEINNKLDTKRVSPKNIKIFGVKFKSLTVKIAA